MENLYDPIEEAAERSLAVAFGVLRNEKGFTVKNIVGYFEESAYGGWEGYEITHLIGILALVVDMALYFRNKEQNDGEED